MAQGDALPSLHTWDIGQNLYVDASNGNDSTGNGTSGSPWQTLQKAHDELKNTVNWVAAGQDVAVNLRAGTYKAGSTAAATLDISFNSGTRAPASDRYLIWKPDTGHEGQVIVQNPDGTNVGKGCVRIQNTGTGLNSYMIWSGIEFDGEDTRKGLIGNGNSYGFYFSGNATNFNTDCEILDCSIHGFQVNGDGVAQSSAQGIATEAGCDNLRVFNCDFYDIGTTTLVSDFQEHAIYQKSTGMAVVNCRIWNIVNGYNIQFYNSNNNTFDGAIVAHCTLDNAEASGIIIHGNALSCQIRNCIISNHTGRGGSSYGIEFFPAPSGSGTSTIDHIVYYNNGTGGSQERSHTPGGWTITNETSDQDPLYVNQGTGDLHLSTGSPAIGYSNTSYSPATDLDGVARPAGAEDAGAYEFVASSGAGSRALLHVGT